MLSKSSRIEAIIASKSFDERFQVFRRTGRVDTFLGPSNREEPWCGQGEPFIIPYVNPPLEVLFALVTALLAKQMTHLVSYSKSAESSKSGFL